MDTLRIVFFGSFQQYSVQVLEKLIERFSIIAVVTTPPRPAGRHLKLTPTEVEQFARTHHIPVLSPEKLDTIPNAPKKPDFIVVAGYGKLIPGAWLDFPKIMAINMHASLLPYYRGAMPAEWAILKGEKETGATLVKMSPEFDKGEILAQKKIRLESQETRETLYRKLYDLGAKLLINYLPLIVQGKIKPKPQPEGDFFYARRLTKDDGFEAWDTLKQAQQTGKKAEYIERKFRALTPWPGLWTKIGEKRLKILSCHLSRSTSTSAMSSVPNGSEQAGTTSLLSLDTVQLEGKRPVSFSQFSSVYLSSSPS